MSAPVDDDYTLERLCEKYPQIPRTIVLKTDLLNRGINYTKDLQRVTEDGLPDTVRGFKCHHVVSDDIDLASLPWSFHLQDDTYIKLILDLDSPYTIRLEPDHTFMIYRREEPIEQVFFPPKPHWYNKTLSNGEPLTSVLFEVGPCHCVGIVPLDYCEYFKKEEQCRYCDWNPTFDMAKAAGYRTQVAMNTELLVEAFEIAFGGDNPNADHAHIVVAGALLNRTKELEMYLRPLEAIKKSPAGRDLRFLCGTQVLDPRDAKRARDAGFINATWNIETWDRRIFESMCPGKSKAVGYERWRDLLLKGVEVFGTGHLSTNFVLGPEVVIPDGFKSHEEAIASNLEGFEWCLQNGIFPFYQVWRCSPGSIYMDLELPPIPTEYYLRLSYEHHKLVEKYQFFSITPPRNRASCYKCGIFYMSYDYGRLMDLEEGPRWFEW